MGCSSCGTGGSKGCGKSGGCSTGGCNKLNSFDWLSELNFGVPKFNMVEVRFKGGRKEFYRNTNKLLLHTGDAIVVDAQSGHHIGYVAMQGDLVRLQMKRKNIALEDENIKDIYRIAANKDLEKFEQARNREVATLFRTRQIID